MRSPGTTIITPQYKYRRGPSTGLVYVSPTRASDGMPITTTSVGGRAMAKDQMLNYFRKGLMTEQQLKDTLELYIMIPRQYEEFRDVFEKRYKNGHRMFSAFVVGKLRTKYYTIHRVNKEVFIYNGAVYNAFAFRTKVEEVSAALGYSTVFGHADLVKDPEFKSMLDSEIRKLKPLFKRLS